LAVLYCFQCSFFKYENRQKLLIQTLLPQSNKNTSLTTGQLLCGGLFSPDSLSNWFSAVALPHALIDNPAQKERLLSVLLAINIGTPPVSLMQQCVILLQENRKTQSQLSLLTLLCRWTSYSPPAVKTLLSIDSSVSHLIALLSSNESIEDLQEILLHSMCALVFKVFQLSLKLNCVV